MITVITPDSTQLEEVSQWPIWEKEPSQFDWKNDVKEMFYILEGTANLSTACGLSESIKAGDLVTVEKDIVINWEITSDIRKHYKFFDS
jgi:uncharacterized cupin superfamily protein